MRLFSSIPFISRDDIVENEIRKLASIWLLATLGAIAFIVKLIYLDGAGDSSSTQIDAKILIALVSFMGTLGLLVLYILDQMVYHRLLNAVFLLRLRMEYCHSFIPPIGTLMMLFSRKRGMAWYMRFYYRSNVYTCHYRACLECFQYFWK